MSWGHRLDPLTFGLLLQFVNGCVCGHSIFRIIRASKRFREMKRSIAERAKYPLLTFIANGEMSWVPQPTEKDVDINHQMITQEIPKNWYIPRQVWHDGD